MAGLMSFTATATATARVFIYSETLNLVVFKQARPRVSSIHFFRTTVIVVQVLI